MLCCSGGCIESNGGGGDDDNNDDDDTDDDEDKRIKRMRFSKIKRLDGTEKPLSSVRLKSYGVGSYVPKVVRDDAPPLGILCPCSLRCIWGYRGYCAH